MAIFRHLLQSVSQKCDVFPCPVVITTSEAGYYIFISESVQRSKCDRMHTLESWPL